MRNCKFSWAEAAPSVEMGVESNCLSLMSVSINVVIWTSATLLPIEKYLYGRNLQSFAMDFSSWRARPNPPSPQVWSALIMGLKDDWALRASVRFHLFRWWKNTETLSLSNTHTWSKAWLKLWECIQSQVTACDHNLMLDSKSQYIAFYIFRFSVYNNFDLIYFCYIYAYILLLQEARTDYHVEPTWALIHKDHQKPPPPIYTRFIGFALIQTD